MNRGDMPPPAPKRVVNPRIRDDQAVHEFYSNSDKMHRATSDDASTQAWFDYSQSVFPQSVRKTGINVELNNVPTYQCSILFNNMGSFNQKSEFQRPENLNKPISKGEKLNVADLSLLREFWGNNYANVILIAEADSLPTDDKELLEDYGWVECHSRRSNDLSVHARIDATVYVRLLWESSEEDDKNTLAAIFEVKFGKKAEEAITDARERTADTLFTELESVALAIEGSDLNITEDNVVHTAKCVQDTKERQVVTRSGLQRLRCRVCHLHHKQAIKAPYRFRQFFSEQYFSKNTASRSMTLLERPMRQHGNTRKSKGTRFVQFFRCRYLERDAT